MGQQVPPVMKEVVNFMLDVARLHSVFQEVLRGFLKVPEKSLPASGQRCFETHSG